jgi:hypothetical protein
MTTTEYQRLLALLNRWRSEIKSHDSGLDYRPLDNESAYYDGVGDCADELESLLDETDEG